MNRNVYLKNPGRECPLWSSAMVVCYCDSVLDVAPLQLPRPGVTVRPTDKEGEGFFAWNVESPRGSHILPLFQYKDVAPQRELLSFRPMEEGEMFLHDGNLYVVKFSQKRGFYLQNIYVLYHEFYAGVEAAIHGYTNVEFMLCRVYVIGRVKQLLGICWIGYAEENECLLYIKLFQADIDRFEAYTPAQLSTEAVNIGEVFYAHDRFWQLCRDEKGGYFIKEKKYPAKMSVIRTS